MPTWQTLPGFLRDLKTLTPEQRGEFEQAVTKFVADLRTGRFRKGLRVKKMAGQDDIWEMTWADDGRATFHYGPGVTGGERHIVWRRIGTHDVFGRP